MTQAQTQADTTVAATVVGAVKLPTLQEILDKTPAKYKPFVQQLGPGLLAMAGNGLDTISTWVMRIGQGDIVGAYKQVVDNLPDDKFIKQWDTDDANIDQHNSDNANQKAAAEKALGMVIQGLLGVASLLLGF